MHCSSSDKETQGGAILKQLIGQMTTTIGNNIASTVDKCSRSNTYTCLGVRQKMSTYFYLNKIIYRVTKPVTLQGNAKRPAWATKKLKNTQYKN